MIRRRWGCLRFGYVAFYYCLSFFVLILVANVILLRHGFNGSELERSVSREALTDVSRNRKVDLQNKWLPVRFKHPVEQYSILERRHRKLMVNVVDTYEDSLLQGNPFQHRMLDCDDIANITDVVYLASGWTKAVYRGNFSGLPVAIKIVDTSGQDVSTCAQKEMSYDRCLEKASQKIMKEISILQALPHENIIKVLGFCVPGQEVVETHYNKVAMVTELGESVDLIKLLQLSWEDRLRISLDVTKLINFLGDTIHGSMAMNDFRRQQFVLVDGQLKLSDVDDAGFGDPTCDNDDQCSLQYSSSNFSHRIPCVDGICSGYNNKRNTYNAGRQFTTFLLPHGAPAALRPMVDKVVDGYSTLNMTQAELVKELERIAFLYRTGWYLKQGRDRTNDTEYVQYPNSDLPGMFDYRCRFSISGSGCTISVFDQKEAEQICNVDPECAGFVLSRQRTWTGRMVIHLKNGFGQPTHNTDTHLYVKPSVHNKDL